MDAVHLYAEKLPTAPHARLHFVGDQQGTERTRLLTQRPQKFSRQIVGARDALHGFDDDGRRVAIDHLQCGIAIVAWNEVDLEGLCRKAVPFLGVPGNGRRCRGAAVKTVRNRQDLVSSCRNAGHPQRIFVCLRTGIHKKRSIETIGRDAHQVFCRLRANLQRHQVALEQQLAALFLQAAKKARVPVAEGGDRMATVQVKNTAAVARKDVTTTGALRDERQLAVHRNRNGVFPAAGVARGRRCAHHGHQVQPGAGAVSPVDSGSFQSLFIHCIAPPAAPLTRLSITLMTTTESPSVATPI